MRRMLVSDTYSSVADLQQEVKPYIGQDLQLQYRVRTDRTLRRDETITGWTMKWVLFADPADTAALIMKSTAAGSITISTPYATVAIAAADLSSLTAGRTYGMQLWRVDSGNTYPLTGIAPFIPRDAPPLTT